MSKKEKLETVDIEDVEILAPGTWHSSTGVTTFEDKDLDEIVASFEEIKGNKEVNYEPPVKLGHSASQKLLQEDGYPAAGWVSSLKKVGNKLLASFVGVPKKIAELIEAGAYKKVSSEIYTAYEIGGKKYGKALKAVSLLGADIPAVKTLNDIVAQYSDENGIPFETVIFEESLDKKVDSVRNAFYRQFQKQVDAVDYIREIFDDYIIITRGEQLYKLPYTTNEAGEPVFDMAKAVKVERIYQEIPETQINNTEEIMEEELRKVLGLDEKADVIGAVTALKAKADSADVKLTEGEQLKEQVAKLTEAIALKERDERVSKAINTGKILPAQKTWADGYAYKDPQGFDAFVESAPKAVELGEKGIQGNESEEVTLTESEKKVAEQMGISTDVLIKAKKEVK
jgi:hypothetical protein